MGGGTREAEDLDHLLPVFEGKLLVEAVTRNFHKTRPHKERTTNITRRGWTEREEKEKTQTHAGKSIWTKLFWAE